MRKGNFLLLLLATMLLLSACGNEAFSEGSAGAASENGGETASSVTEDINSATSEVFAMDTYMTVTCYGDRCEEAVAAAIAEIERLDALLSVGEADSEIACINANGCGTLSEDTLTMV